MAVSNGPVVSLKSFADMFSSQGFSTLDAGSVTELGVASSCSATIASDIFRLPVDKALVVSKKKKKIKQHYFNRDN